MTFHEAFLFIGIVATALLGIALGLMIIDTHERVKRIEKYLEEEEKSYDDQQS